MQELLNWIKGARWRYSASHCVEGFIIFLPAALLLHNFFHAAFCVVVWYWSRKKIEVEEANLATDQTHVDTWALGWFPWNWSQYQCLDVLMPAVWFYLLAWVL